MFYRIMFKETNIKRIEIKDEAINILDFIEEKNQRKCEFLNFNLVGTSNCYKFLYAIYLSLRP